VPGFLGSIPSLGPSRASIVDQFLPLISRFSLWDKLLMLARLGPRLGIEPRKPGTNSTRPSPCKPIDQVEIMLEKDVGAQFAGPCIS
jgi:hypothetical protein